MLQRMIGAARLTVHAYEDVELDQTATKQALLVVVIVSIASGIGALATRDAFILKMLVVKTIGIILWAIWAYITFLEFPRKIEILKGKTVENFLGIYNDLSN